MHRFAPSNVANSTKANVKPCRPPTVVVAFRLTVAGRPAAPAPLGEAADAATIGPPPALVAAPGPPPPPATDSGP